MKWTGFIWMLFVAFPVMAQERIDSSFDNNHYRNRLALFRILPERKKEIVFVGNSITEAGIWSELIQGKNVANRGISGDVSFGILNRLDEVLDRNPAKIFLLCGINDLKRGIPETYIIENYRRIIAEVKRRSPRTKLYLQSVLPVNQQMLSASYSRLNREKIQSLNRQMKEVALTNRINYVELTQVFADEEGELKKEFTTDGIHLKPAAYIEWVKYLRKNKYL